MYHSILLVKSKQKLVIPTKWIFSFDILQIFYRGLSPTKLHKIFFFNDESCEADFNLPVRDDFDETVPACYLAQIKGTFGRKSTAVAYTKKHRAVLAKVYNDNLVKYDWNPPQTEAAALVAIPSQNIRIKMERNVEELQGRIQHLQNRIGVEDLTEEEIADLQIVIMDNDGEDEPPLMETFSPNISGDLQEVENLNQNNEPNEELEEDNNTEAVFDPVCGFIPYVTNVSK